TCRRCSRGMCSRWRTRWKARTSPSAPTARPWARARWWRSATPTACACWAGAERHAPPGPTRPRPAGASMDLISYSPALVLVVIVALALAPFVAVMVTSFTKIVVVLSLLRNALGLQQVQPNVVINGLAIVLSVYVMYPVILDTYEAVTAHQQGRPVPASVQAGIDERTQAQAERRRVRAERAAPAPTV